MHTAFLLSGSGWKMEFHIYGYWNQINLFKIFEIQEGFIFQKCKSDQNSFLKQLYKDQFTIFQILYYIMPQMGPQSLARGQEKTKFR